MDIVRVYVESDVQSTIWLAWHPMSSSLVRFPMWQWGRYIGWGIFVSCCSDRLVWNSSSLPEIRDESMPRSASCCFSAHAARSFACISTWRGLPGRNSMMCLSGNWTCRQFACSGGIAGISVTAGPGLLRWGATAIFNHMPKNRLQPRFSGRCQCEWPL